MKRLEGATPVAAEGEAKGEAKGESKTEAKTQQLTDIVPGRTGPAKAEVKVEKEKK